MWTAGFGSRYAGEDEFTAERRGQERVNAKTPRRQGRREEKEPNEIPVFLGRRAFTAIASASAHRVHARAAVGAVALLVRGSAP